MNSSAGIHNLHISAVMSHLCKLECLKSELHLSTLIYVLGRIDNFWKFRMCESVVDPRRDGAAHGPSSASSGGSGPGSGDGPAAAERPDRRVHGRKRRGQVQVLRLRRPGPVQCLQDEFAQLLRRSGPSSGQDANHAAGGRHRGLQGDAVHVSRRRMLQPGVLGRLLSGMWQCNTARHSAFICISYVPSRHTNVVID